MINARIVFVATTAETASLGIAKAILACGKFHSVHGDFPYEVYQYKDCYLIIEDQTLAGDPELDWEQHFTCETFVILYRHSGRAGKKRLTVHPLGNVTDAPLAGNPLAVAAVHPLYLRHMLLMLQKTVKEQHSDYLVNYEVTHHGPTTLKTPVFFVEAGDGEDQWKDETAHQLISSAVHCFIESPVATVPCAIGFGGDHYGERFERRTNELAFGHMIPERNFEHLNEQLLNDLVNKTVPKVDVVVWDKKKQGTQEQRDFVLGYFERKKIEVRKI